MDTLITRGRRRASKAPSALGGLAVLLVSLSDGARQGLVVGQPLHLRVPIGAGMLDLVIVGDDTELLPPDIEAVLANAAVVVQVTDQEGGV